MVPKVVGSNPIFHPENLVTSNCSKVFLCLIVSSVLWGGAMAVKGVIAKFEDIAKIVQHAH